ncbi:hypothetical protein [uncultured Psychrobacter sp.]|uniref:hypothetical protein n=1 Tax=uncultured Psychrobacter sp. TaxID=259303 RepID=UPI0030DB6778
MKELIALNKSRIQNNNLSEWLLLGYCWSNDDYRQAFLSPDTSEHFKILIFDKKNVSTEQGFWFDTEEEVNCFIESWSNREITTNSNVEKQQTNSLIL